MPKLAIPSIGDTILLSRDWEFPLYFEYRNSKFVDAVRQNTYTEMSQLDKMGWSGSISSLGSLAVCLEKGTLLKVDRIYIRSGKSSWDSITFRIKEAPKDNKRKRNERYKGHRFWAKLSDVNEIYGELIQEA